MKRILSILLILALCTLSIPALADGGTVTATGTGTVSLVPDMASFSVGITTQDALVATAQAANAATLQAVLDTLISLGVSADDLQTNSYSVYPVYDYSASVPNVTGYEVTNTVSVVVREAGKMPALLDAAVEAGANNVYSLGFQSSEQSTAYDQALKAATQDALRKAALMAQAIGKEAGATLSLEELSSVNTYLDSRISYAMDSSYATPIEIGHITVTAQVQAEVELQ